MPSLAQKLKIPRPLLFLLAVYVLGIFFFTAFRLLLLLTNLGQLAPLPDKTSLILRALFMGFRFDSAVSGYLLSIPLLIIIFLLILGLHRRGIYRGVTYYLIAGYILSFFICCADIPYFHQFFTRLNVAAFNWNDNPQFIFGMIIGEFNFYVYFFVFIAATWIFILAVSHLHRRVLLSELLSHPRSRGRRLGSNLVFSLLACVLLFVALRGRVAQKSPLRVGTAYFSNYAFPNQLGLNPVFTLLRSYLDAHKPENRELHLLPDSTAIHTVQSYLKIQEEPFPSPIARRVVPAIDPWRANVIVVIMESQSAAYMRRYGNRENLTPVLDSLAEISYCFDHFYSDGIHTYNGIYATLFSFPVLLKKHPMKGTVIPDLTGFARTLGEQGYTSLFFMTHDGQFDNMSGFLHANGFQQVISQKDYPRNKILSNLGVSDSYMYEFSIPLLNELAEQNRPFFAGYLTASNHSPMIIPDGIPFKPRSRDPRKAIIEYCDWAVGQFLRLASHQSWYDSTLFVFLADHGAVIGNTPYDIPLTYVHSPLIIFAPKLLPEPCVFNQLGGQIDVFPTIMGLLNVNYVNNTLGVDLLRTTKPFVSFSMDDKIGCLNGDFLWIYHDDGLESLHQYSKGDPTNYLTEYPALADSMETYAFSMLQAAQEVVRRRQAGFLHFPEMTENETK